MLLLWQCLFLAGASNLVLASPAFNPSDFIHSLGATSWGFWGTIETCPEGSYAYGFEIKLERQHGIYDDDTSINGIRLFCRTVAGVDTGEITSSVMTRGSWRGSDYCQTGYLRGYDLKSHADEGSIGDNTAANALRMYCTNETNYIEGPGNKWGHWLGPSYCHDGMVICGIITLVEENQGTFTDDTALNDVRFKCCDLPA